MDHRKNKLLPDKSSVASLVQAGVDWLRMDCCNEAEQCFRQVLSLQDDHPDACHLLAVSMLRQNRGIEQAIQFIEIALESFPEQPIFLNSLGTAMWQSDRIDAALDIFQRVVALKPDYVEAHYNLGNVWRRLNQSSAAIAQYQTAIDLDPGYVNAYNDLGLLYHARSGYRKAIEQFSLALELDPARADLHLNLANSLQSLGEFEAALISVHNALALSPNDARMYNNLGSIYGEQGNSADAISALRRSVELDPTLSWAFYNLGYFLHEAGEYQEALEMFDKTIALDPDWASVRVNKGNTLYRMNRFHEAIDSLDNALGLSPDFVVAHMNLATIHRRLCNLEKAVEYYRKALALRPDHASSHLGIALVLLKLGQFQAGWRHYEWRFEATKKHYIVDLSLARPEWTGEPFDGKTLMVMGEQGSGDVIHFIRYLPQLKELGGRVILRCSPGLIRLMKSVPGIDEFVDRNETSKIEFEYHVPLLSLPRIFGTDLQSIPGDVPYLFAEETAVLRWSRRLDNSRFNVGIAWAGNPEQAEDQYRSCPLSALAPLGDIEGASFYSLQKGSGTEQLEQLAGGFQVVDYTDELADFADTAALVQSLDLVITIDTAAAHLAGALGRPVWTLLWFAHCWRYLQDREDSPWYPTMRLFKQPRLGDWEAVVKQVATALSERIAQK